jgi:hypothetical protein
MYAISASSIDKLTHTQDKLEQSLWFNKGVLELKNKNYKEAIYIFNQTKKVNKLPSLLNIAIARLNQKKESLAYKLFLELSKPSIKDQDLYVYLSANMYIYKITKDKKYLNIILNEYEFIFDSSDRERIVLVDTLIELGDYKKAEYIIDRNEDINFYKKAILALVNNNFDDAIFYLNETLAITYDKNRKLEIRWFLTYIDLKLNNISDIESDIDHIQRLKIDRYINDKYPLNLFVNTNKFDMYYYLKQITKLDLKTKIDLLFYFTSYKFSDEAQIQYSITDSFFLLKKEMINNLTNMTQYNKLLLKLVQGDPYMMRYGLENFKYDEKKSYMYFNLALSHARIGEYKDAMQQFQIALNLNPGNRLYALYVLLSAKQINKTLRSHKALKVQLNQSYGENARKAKILNKLLLTKSDLTHTDFDGIADDRIGEYIEYLYCIDTKDDCRDLLFFENRSDPIKDMLYLSLNNNQSQYKFISNIQDNIKISDKIYLQPTLISDMYIKYLKSVGLQSRINNIKSTRYTPLAVKLNTIIDIYNNSTLNNLSEYINVSEKYNMHGKDELFLQASALLLTNNNDEDAYIVFSYMNTIYKDNESSFLIGLRYLKANQFEKALEYLDVPFNHEYIDFRIEGLDKLLKEI